MQDNPQQGIVDVDLAVVFDEAQFSGFVHEQIDSRACGTDHLRQHLLRYFGKDLLRLDPAPHDEAQAASEQREECGGSNMGTEIPGIQLHESQATEEASSAESGGTESELFRGQVLSHSV